MNSDISQLLLIEEEKLRSIINEEVTNALAKIKDRPKRRYTRKEASNILHVSMATLDAYIKRGDVVAYRIGHRVLIDANALDEAIEKGRVQRYKQHICIKEE